jgi:hypothetical protein
MGDRGVIDLTLSDDADHEILHHEIDVEDLTDQEQESWSDGDIAEEDPVAPKDPEAGRVSEASPPRRTLPGRPFVSPRARACPDCFKSMIHVEQHRQRGGCRPPTLEFLVAALEKRAPHLLKSLACRRAAEEA